MTKTAGRFRGRRPMLVGPALPAADRSRHHLARDRQPARAECPSREHRRLSRCRVDPRRSGEPRAPRGSGVRVTAKLFVAGAAPTLPSQRRTPSWWSSSARIETVRRSPLPEPADRGRRRRVGGLDRGVRFAFRRQQSPRRRDRRTRHDARPTASLGQAALQSSSVSSKSNCSTSRWSRLRSRHRPADEAHARSSGTGADRRVGRCRTHCGWFAWPRRPAPACCSARSSQAVLRHGRSPVAVARPAGPGRRPPRLLASHHRTGFQRLKELS